MIHLIIIKYNDGKLEMHIYKSELHDNFNEISQICFYKEAFFPLH